MKNTVVKLQEQLTEQKLIIESISEQNIKLKPLIEFIEGFESQEKLQKFLDLLKSSSVISFPQHETALVRWNLSPELQERVKVVAEASGRSEDSLIQEATEEEIRRLAKKHGIPLEEFSKKKQSSEE